ncbi:MAG TPA: hypothetical protein VLF66_02060, partial [Thermoanaerobaculia bacterium]|nr:hypothetical protein [Thermoanaerobaculia bacterium]
SGEDAPCASGEPLLPGTYRALARGDRDLAVERSREVRLRVLQVRTRGSEEDDPRIPVLLEPRETSVTDPRPEIRWTRVTDAEEYLIELVGPSGWTERLRAGEVPCRPEPRPPGELEVCAAPWPAGAPDLEPAASYFLTVGARTGIATPVRKGEARRLRLLPAGATGLAASLGALRELGLPAAEESLRAAALLADHGLLADAAAALRRSLLEAPSARTYLLQGSLDLELALPRAALRSFREAARLAADAPDLLAEAEAGGEAARRLLGKTGDTAAEDPDPILLEVGRLMEEIQRDMEGFRLADALRRVDIALSLVDGRGYDATEVALRAYRGALLSGLQEHEAALPDLRQLTDVLAAEAAKRRAPGVPDPTPLIDFLPDLLLSMASGDWAAGAERFQALGRDYGDQLPPQLQPLLELLSLIQEERAAEAAGLCREMRSGEVLGISNPPPEISGLLDMMCTTLDFLAAMPEEGPGDPSEVTTLLEAAGKSLESQHGPLREPLELLLGQVMTLPGAAGRPEAWPTADQLRPALQALQAVISRAAPSGLRAGLDGVW